MNDTPGYSRPVASHIEERLMNRVETPEDLLADIATALTREHSFAAYEYEERYLKIHHPTRLCPSCGDVVRLRVVVNRDTDQRSRECPDCGVLESDAHVNAELLEIHIDARARRGGRRV